MIPILYNETETAFTSNGIGRLSEAISCIVTEERNGEYELEMEYPISGKYYSEIRKSRIIFAVPADGKTGQAFRIYKITKPIGGIITVNAEHISYQLSLIPVTPFEASTSNTARVGIWSNAVGTNPFTVWSDMQNSTASYKVTVPKSLRACLGGSRGSYLDVYGGEFEWDNWNVKIHAQRGTNRGVTIRYGKNLTDFEQEENIQDVITGILPYWHNEESNTLVMLDSKVVMSSYANNYPFRRVLPVDLTEKFENAPTQQQLLTAAQSYISSNDIGIPKISIKVSFVPLYQSEEYKGKANVERVNLCDTVSVYFEKFGITATAKVIKTKYNVLLDRYESIELGDAKSSFSDTIVKQQEKAEEIETKIAEKAAFLQRAITHATQLISGGLGGYVVIEPNPTTGYPEEILIMDNPDKEQAVNCIRINKNGIGFSQDGYEPENFSTAWTIDGTFNANYIAAGEIDTSLLKTGTISDHNGNTTYDLDTGELKSKNLVIDTQTDGGTLEIKSKYFEVERNGDVTITNGTLNNANIEYSLYVKRSTDPAYGNYVSALTNNDFVFGTYDYNREMFDRWIFQISTGLSDYTSLYGHDYPETAIEIDSNNEGGLSINSTSSNLDRDAPIVFLNAGKNPNGHTEDVLIYGDIGIIWSQFKKQSEWPSGAVDPTTFDYFHDYKVTLRPEFSSDTNHPRLKLIGDFVVDGNIWCDGGDLIAKNGQKYRAVKTEHYGRVGLAAMESPEPVFSDFGGGVIDIDGRCYIEFDKTFCETVDLSCDYRAFVTKTSHGEIDYIEKRNDSFVVHGEPNTAFDWIVYVKQRGYSECRFTNMDAKR